MKEKPLWEMSEHELQEGLVSRLLMIRGVGAGLWTETVPRGEFDEVRTCLDALERACANAKMYMNAMEEL